jgi:hypothetical protein
MVQEVGCFGRIKYQLRVLSYDHTNYTTFHIHIHYNCLQFCGKDMVSKDNWLAGAGTDRLALIEELEFAIS